MRGCKKKKKKKKAGGGGPKKHVQIKGLEPATFRFKPRSLATVISIHSFSRKTFEKMRCILNTAGPFSEMYITWACFHTLTLTSLVCSVCSEFGRCILHVVNVIVSHSVLLIFYLSLYEYRVLCVVGS